MISTMSWMNQYYTVSSSWKDTTKICDISGEKIAWTGRWDATTDNARGQSKIERTRNHRGCAITNWSTVDLTFTSADEFWGNISYRQRITEDGECGEPCNVTWGITGVRK